VLTDLRQIDEGQIRKPERHIGHPGARNVDRLEAEAGDYAGR
jgi:hypothetical protein